MLKKEVIVTTVLWRAKEWIWFSALLQRRVQWEWFCKGDPVTRGFPLVNLLVGRRDSSVGRRDSSVGTMTGYGFRFPAVRDFYFPHSVQTGSGTHPGSSPAGVKRQGLKAGQEWWSYNFTPPYVFMA
jgi:hypothetical protein